MAPVSTEARYSVQHVRMEGTFVRPCAIIAQPGQVQVVEAIRGCQRRRLQGTSLSMYWIFDFQDREHTLTTPYAF